MKVLFTYPDYMHGRYKPIGISLLSSVVKEKGHQVRFFDTSDYEKPEKDPGVENLLFKRYKLPPAEEDKSGKDIHTAFQEEIGSFQPDLIAVSVTYLLFRNGLRLIAGLKNRRVPTIFGGVHVTLNPEEVIAYPEVDMICRGEGEEPLLELLEAMERGKDYSQIPNLWVKKGDKVFRNPLRPMRASLDDLPFLDWSIYPDSHFYKPYVGQTYRAGDLIASRGCYFNCSYCFQDAYYRTYGQKRHTVVWMSPQRVMEELAFLTKKYNIGLVKMRDADFMARQESELEEMASLYEEMNQDMPKVLINVNARTVTKEKVRCLKKMNCVSVTMGLESGNDALRRKVLNRVSDNKQFIKAVGWFKDFGIRVASGNMIGIPHETRDNVFETISVNRQAGVDLADVSVLFPFPGTPIHDYCKEEGFLKKELSEQDYYRAEPVLDMPQLKREDITGIMKTFQMYMNAPKWLYPLIRKAEGDTPQSKRLHKMLNKIFYYYIFYVRSVFKRIKRVGSF